MCECDGISSETLNEKKNVFTISAHVPWAARVRVMWYWTFTIWHYGCMGARVWPISCYTHSSLIESLRNDLILIYKIHFTHTLSSAQARHRRPFVAMSRKYWLCCFACVCLIMRLRRMSGLDVSLRQFNFMVFLICLIKATCKFLPSHEQHNRESFPTFSIELESQFTIENYEMQQNDECTVQFRLWSFLNWSSLIAIICSHEIEWFFHSFEKSHPYS